ncbi:MAG: YceI family protein [Verrucomicrobiota bacterium]
MKTQLNKILLSLTSTIVLAGVGATSRGADLYKVDPVHSSIVFRVKHLGVANVYGRFNEISGTVSFDKENPSKSAVDITVPVESVDTHVQKRDQHLKSPDFFNAKEFPVMTFKSKQVKKINEDTYQMTGDFALHGVTKSLTIDFKKGGETKGMQNEYRSGGEAQFTIKRSDYGMNFMLNGVGDEVTVMVAIEGVRQ